MKQNLRSLQLITLVGLLVLLPVIIVGLYYRQTLTPKADTPTIDVQVRLSATEKYVNETLTMDVSMTSTTPVSAAYIVLDYNPRTIGITAVKGDTTVFTDDLSTLPESSTNGKVALSVVSKKNEAELPKGIIHVGEITVKGIASGTSPIEVNEAETQIIGPAPGAYALFAPHQTQNSTVTISTGLNDPPKISFNLKVQGVNRKGPNIPAKVRIVKPNTTSSWDFTTTLVSDNNGIYAPSERITLTGVAARQEYRILVKGQKHLQKVMEAGRMLQAGDNNENIFDWKGKAILPGDLPNPTQNNAQDGRINALDTSLLLERFSKNDASSAAVADLNYDGTVNLNDFAQLLLTWGTSERDEE